MWFQPAKAANSRFRKGNCSSTNDSKSRIKARNNHQNKLLIPRNLYINIDPLDLDNIMGNLIQNSEKKMSPKTAVINPKKPKNLYSRKSIHSARRYTTWQTIEMYSKNKHYKYVTFSQIYRFNTFLMKITLNCLGMNLTVILIVIWKLKKTYH